MPQAQRIREQGDSNLLDRTPQESDDGPEFSSEPMPAAFSACVFLGCTVMMGLLFFAVFW